MIDKSQRIIGDIAENIKTLVRPIQPDRHPTSKFYIFERYIDVIMCGALIGFRFNRKGETQSDLSKSEYSTESQLIEIPINTMLKEQGNLKRIYRLIMLNEDDRKLPADERINNAFRYSRDEDERVKANMKLFESYISGGIEILIDRFRDILTQEEAVEQMQRLYEDIQMTDEESIIIG